MLDPRKTKKPALRMISTTTDLAPAETLGENGLLAARQPHHLRACSCASLTEHGGRNFGLRNSEKVPWPGNTEAVGLLPSTVACEHREPNRSLFVLRKC